MVEIRNLVLQNKVAVKAGFVFKQKASVMMYEKATFTLER
jgi:hypothetical protein